MFPDDDHPVTTTVGLLRVEVEAAVDVFRTWQRTILRPHGGDIEEFTHRGTFKQLLESLYPLEVPIASRSAFVATHSPWTAYFDNSRLGTQAATVMPVLAERLGCEAIRAVMVGKETPDAKYPAAIFELYRASMTPTRTVYAADDGGKWRFGSSGEPMAGEEVERYSEKRIRDRFTPDALKRMLLHLGCRPFDEDWYDASRASLLRRT